MSTSHSLRTDDRGVSELIGFVVVFGIIISSVGLLYMTGFQAMGDYQEREQTKNAERAMDALAENFNDIVRNDGVKYRAGELTLRKGTISYDENGTVISDNITSVGNGSGTFIYEHGGTEVVYEGGAVVRSTNSVDWMVSDPPMRCSSNVAIISLVEIDGDESAMTAHGSQEVTAIQQGTTAETVTGPITITVDSDRSEAWNRTLTKNGWEMGPGSNEYVCDTNEAVVRKTTIEIDYT